jgi:hypothetical protein
MMASFGDWLGGLSQWLGKAQGMDTHGTTNQTGSLPAGQQLDLMNTVGYPAPNVLGAATAPSQAPNDLPDYGGGGGNAGGGASAAAYDPNYDPAKVSAARNQVNPLIAQLNQLYDSLNGNINDYATDQRGIADNNFNLGMGQAGDVLKKADNGTDMAYGARGTLDSSFHGNALDANKTDFNHAVDDLTKQRDGDYATIGGTINGARAAIANKPSYDLSQFNDVQSLLDLRSQLDSHINNLQGTQRSLMTQPKLKAITETAAPVTGLDKALKARLDTLASAAAPPEAKYGIGAGYISSSQLPDDQKDKWNQYLSSLLGSSAKAA